MTVRVNEEFRTPPTSLFNLLNKKVNREELLAGLCNCFENRVMGQSWNEVMEGYRKHDILLQQENRIVVEEKGTKRLATAIDFNEHGALIVRYDGETEDTMLTSEDVSIRPAEKS